MAALGIDPHSITRNGRTTWISITGYGREGTNGDRVAFGDDAAFAAGCTVGAPPRFVGDALADPIAGLYAAAVALAALGGHRGQVVDVALRDVAAYARGAGSPGMPYDGPVAPPRARPARGAARPFGADTDAVRSRA
jgi:crotonobetainyl-CoA:carnitine CoA-transferase CaiB-like acyl-CoA transferase